MKTKDRTFNEFSIHLIVNNKDPKKCNILLCAGSQAPTIGHLAHLEHSIVESGVNIFDVFAQLKEKAAQWCREKNIPLAEGLTPDTHVSLCLPELDPWALRHV